MMFTYSTQDVSDSAFANNYPGYNTTDDSQVWPTTSIYPSQVVLDLTLTNSYPSHSTTDTWFIPSQSNLISIRHYSTTNELFTNSQAGFRPWNWCSDIPLETNGYLQGSNSGPVLCIWRHNLHCPFPSVNIIIISFAISLKHTLALVIHGQG